MGKTRLAVLFGGRSGEHEVSLVSAVSVMAALDPQTYEIIPIGIDKQGRWLTGSDVLASLRSGAIRGDVHPCMLSADPTRKELLLLDTGAAPASIPIDAAFPVLHGTHGEDGTIQGLFELSDLPYVGAGVLASSIGMDKVMQKRIHAQAGLPVVPFASFRATAWDRNAEGILQNLEQGLGYPVFVKPPNLGSSVGISKARNRDELVAAIERARRFDRTVIVEHAVEDAREIEVAVLGNEHVQASIPGEVVPSNEFYDYDAKYVDGASATIIPAALPDDVQERVRALAIDAYQAIGCEGMARIDFLVTRGTYDIVLNEVNTIPGFTSISMYPKLFEATGLSYRDLLHRLIDLAFERHAQKSALVHSYEPKKGWHTEGGA